MGADAALRGGDILDQFLKTQLSEPLHVSHYGLFY